MNKQVEVLHEVLARVILDENELIQYHLLKICKAHQLFHILCIRRISVNFIAFTHTHSLLVRYMYVWNAEDVSSHLCVNHTPSN